MTFPVYGISNTYIPRNLILDMVVICLLSQVILILGVGLLFVVN